MTHITMIRSSLYVYGVPEVAVELSNAYIISCVKVNKKYRIKSFFMRLHFRNIEFEYLVSTRVHI